VSSNTQQSAGGVGVGRRGAAGKAQRFAAGDQQLSFGGEGLELGTAGEA